MASQSIDQVLRILKDGQWHDVSEVAEKISLSPLKIQLVTDFLARFTFIELNRKNQKMKLSPPLTRFFQKISSHETERSSRKKCV